MMKDKKWKSYTINLLVVSVLLLLVPCITYAVPGAINYQGYLTDSNGDPLDGSFSIQFAIYDTEVGGTPIWSEIHSNVSVTKGIFNAILGNNTPIVPSYLEGDRYLGVQVGTDEEMSPRRKLTSVAFAIRAQVAESALNGVPIGTVLDWWRPNSEWPVPDGFKVCDGTEVSDEDSPLNGISVPDLRDKFILGVSNVNDIGVVGGQTNHAHNVDINHDHAVSFTSASGIHSHDIDPPIQQTSTSGLHSHSVDIPNYTASLSTEYAGSHNHEWSWLYTDSANHRQWGTYLSDGTPELIYLWNNGIGNEGEGCYPLCASLDNYHYTKKGGVHQHTYHINHDHPAVSSSSSGNHSHSVDIATFTSGNSGLHEHSFDLPPLGSQIVSTENESNLPPYYGLLKIMRIK